MIIIENISVLSIDKDFLKRLLTFRSYDQVQRAFSDKGIDISFERIDKLKNIVQDLEENEDNLASEDLQVIKEAAIDTDIEGYFDQKLYNLFYNWKDKYPPDFFLSKNYYDGDTISTGIFTIACVLYVLKKEYLKTRDLWGIN